MTKDQIKAISDTLDIIELCNKTIEAHCNSELVPDDPEAIEANKFGSFPAWLEESYWSRFNEIYNSTQDIKYVLSMLRKNIKKEPK